MDIITFLRESAEATAGVKSFGHGPRSYANLEQEQQAMERYGWSPEFPRVWVYPVLQSDEFLKNGAIQRVHEINLDVNDLCDFGDTTKGIEEKLASMSAIATELQIRISKHTDFRGFTTDVARVPNYHYLDANLCGWTLVFKVKINDEIVFPCP